MDNNLFLITAGFPFDTGETFIESELPFLCDRFNEVIIIAVNPQDESKHREVPSNCIVKTFKNQSNALSKIFSLGGFFSAQVRKEFDTVRKHYKLKLSFGIIKTALISWYNAKQIGKKVKSVLNDSRNGKSVLYSYWCDDSALAIANFIDDDAVIKISRIHRWDVYFEESEVGYLPFRKLISDKLNTIYSISEDGIQYGCDRWRTNADTFKLSRLGISNERELSIGTQEDFTLVSCSNLIPVKRVGDIVDGLGLIKGKKIKWVHFGDGPLMTDVEEKVNHLSSNIEVIFFGQVSNQDVYKFYEKNKPNLFINISSSEGVPVSIMEALSFGIPVIATNVGGNSEIVTSKNGLLLSANPTNLEVATAIELFLEMDSITYKNYAYSSYNMWNTKYNAELNFTNFVDDICCTLSTL